ncbi:MAG: hypothetical protein ACLSEU_02420 [Streptococcus salivarius]
MFVLILDQQAGASATAVELRACALVATDEAVAAADSELACDAA